MKIPRPRISLLALRPARTLLLLGCLVAACLAGPMARATTPAELESLDSLMTRHQAYLAAAPASQERAAALAVLVDYLAADDIFVRQLAERYCYRADPAEFDAATRVRVAAHFIDKPHLKKPDILLIDAMGALPQLLAQPEFSPGELEVSVGRWYNTPAWALLLARARDGDADALATVLARAASADLDPIERATRLLPDLGYLRQPQAVDQLRVELFSEERLSGRIPGVPGTPVAHWAAHVLTEVLDGCPIKRQAHPAYYNHIQIETLRHWIVEQSHYSFRD